MAKKPLYIYDESNNNVEYYIPSDNVFVNEDHSTTLTEFYEAYQDSSGAVLNADTGRVDASKSTVVALDSMELYYDGESHTLSDGDYVYRHLYRCIWYYKSTSEAPIELPVDEGLIYCNKHTGKLYRFDGDEMVEVGNLNFVNTDTLTSVLSGFVYTLGSVKIHPECSRILPVESMGSTLDNVDEEGNEQWQFSPTNNSPALYIAISGNTATVKNENNETVADVDKQTRYINRHTGRSYRWTGSQFVEEPTPGSSISPAAVIPYIGENGNWWVNGTDTEQPAQGDAGEVVIVNNLNTETDDYALSASQGYILKREFERLVEYLQDDNIGSFVPNWESSALAQFYVAFVGVGFTFQGATAVTQGDTNYAAVVSAKMSYQITAVDVTMEGMQGSGVIKVKKLNAGMWTIDIAVITGNVTINVTTSHVVLPGSVSGGPSVSPENPGTNTGNNGGNYEENDES